MDKRLLIGLAVAAVITVALYWLTGDTKALVTGDLANNQEEMTALAQSMLSGETDEALLDKYTATYDIDCYAQQEMVQFTVAGSAYNGVYYSASDEPLAFQGTEAELTADDSGWTWIAEGDNGGRTEKLSDNWYYFEAWF